MQTARTMRCIVPAAIVRSAEITADAWGVAYIGITRENERAAGGRWHVTRSQDSPHYSGQPVTWLQRVTAIDVSPWFAVENI